MHICMYAYMQRCICVDVDTSQSPFGPTRAPPRLCPALCPGRQMEGLLASIGDSALGKLAELTAGRPQRHCFLLCIILYTVNGLSAQLYEPLHVDVCWMYNACKNAKPGSDSSEQGLGRRFTVLLSRKALLFQILGCVTSKARTQLSDTILKVRLLVSGKRADDLLSELKPFAADSKRLRKRLRLHVCSCPYFEVKS